MTMVNVSRQFSSSPPTADTNNRIILNTGDTLLNNNKIQLKDPMCVESPSTKVEPKTNPSTISASKDNKSISLSQPKVITANEISKMTAEHIHRHLQQFRPQQNILLLPHTQSEASAASNMQPLFKNVNVGSTSENKSNTISSNGSHLKSAFSIRSLLSGGGDSKEGVGNIAGNLGHHLNKLVNPLSQMNPTKHLDNNNFNPSHGRDSNDQDTDDFVDVDGGMIDEEDEGDIDLEEDELLENSEDNKCDAENMSDDGNNDSSAGDGKKDEDKDENLTPEEKAKVK